MNRRSFAESLALAALAPALGVPAGALRLDFGRLDGASLEYGSRLTAGELAGVAEQIQAGLDRADLIRSRRISAFELAEAALAEARERDAELAGSRRCSS